MKKILLFGAGKSATFLIEYLCKACEENNWSFLVCDTDLLLAKSKIGNCKNATALSLDVSNKAEREKLVEESTIVISMLPPHLHFLVATDCLRFSKNLLTASYVDEEIKLLAKEIEQKGLLFLCEMGLDPGIDHMSAMKIINGIKNIGGNITSFKSHCGGLISPESDNNPWHYKITWNPANIVMAGSSGAIYKYKGEIVTIPYRKIFSDCNEVKIPGLTCLAWYPNRNSLTYVDTYGLGHADTFIRTTLRYPSFCRGWNKIVNMGLTDLNDHEEIKKYKTYHEWYQQKNKTHLQSPGIDEEFNEQVNYLELNSNNTINAEVKNSAGLLQNILEKKLGMHQDDKDMIVMLHEIGYKLNNQFKEIKSCLVVKGENKSRTAMAKTVGLPLGIATRLILQDKINIIGLHIPTLAEFYEPVLKELEEYEVKFKEF